MGGEYGCSGKVKYASYTDAKKKVRAMKRNKHIYDKGHQALDFYRCSS